MTTYLIYNVANPGKPFFVTDDWDTPRMQQFKDTADDSLCVIVDVAGKRRYFAGEWKPCKDYDSDRNENSADVENGVMNPMRPIVMVDGVARFKANKIVRYLLDWCSPRGEDLNSLARMGNLFSRDDWNQFNQLIGYSVSGFGDLSCADPETVAKADAIVEAMMAKEKR